MPFSQHQFPLLCEKGFCVFSSDSALHHRRRIRLVKFLTFVCKWCPLHRRKRHRSWKGIASIVLDEVASSSRHSLVAWLYYHLARGRCGFWLFYFNKFQLSTVRCWFSCIFNLFSQLRGGSTEINLTFKFIASETIIDTVGFSHVSGC